MGTRSRGRAVPWTAAGTLAVALSIAGAALPAAATAAPEYANPSPNSPAGSEYSLPFDQARNTGQSQHHGHGHGSGGSNSNGSAGARRPPGTGSRWSGSRGNRGTPVRSPLVSGGVPP